MAAREVDAFADVVRSHRRRLGLTQEELAERAGVSERAIRDLERGSKHVPRKETVQLLADALELGGAERQAFQLAARRMRLPGHRVPLQSLHQDLAASPTNLPGDPTSFIGREDEVVELLALLQRPTVRLVTLTGPGGIGKTRLALQAAGQRRAAFTDGVYVVSLASLSDPSLVPTAIALTLGIEERAGQPLLDTLIAFLRTKQLLLLLDNYEHLLPAADVVSHLLAACSQLQILVTSRAVLHLAAEHEYPVPPLTVPNLAHLPDLEVLAQYDAVALFLERAQAVQPAFTLTEQNAGTMAEICARLDGLPLAIELAAARLRLLPPQALLGRLDQSLRLLTSGPRDHPLRQQTLRATLDWSYRLLTPMEERLFARLSVFAGGYTIRAAEAVCQEGPNEDLLSGLGALVDQSLVQQVERTGDEPRFQMLATIREYAAERLAEQGDAGLIAQRRDLYYLRLAETADSALGGERQRWWLQHLEMEHNNLREVLMSLAAGQQADQLLQLTVDLYRFWYIHGHLTEGYEWLTRALLLPETNPGLRARALHAAAAFQLSFGLVAEAEAALRQGLALSQELGDKRTAARCLAILGTMAAQRSQYRQAERLIQRSMELLRLLSDEPGLALSTVNLGAFAEERGDPVKAEELYHKSLSAFRAINQPRGIALCLTELGLAATRRGEYDRGRKLLEESLGICRDLDDKQLLARTLHRLGQTALGKGSLQPAEALFIESLGIAQGIEEKDAIVETLISLADVARLQQNLERATPLYEEALALGRESRVPRLVALALLRSGDLARLCGDIDRARDLYREGASLAQTLEDVRLLIDYLESAAIWVTRQGDTDFAVRLWGTADAQREALGERLPPLEREQRLRDLTALRRKVSDGEWNAHFTAGRAITLEQALSRALEEVR